ncbi:hypothetical protein JCM12296A_07750 [Desulfosarcina cetonica]
MRLAISLKRMEWNMAASGNGSSAVARRLARIAFLTQSDEQVAANRVDLRVALTD